MFAQQTTFFLLHFSSHSTLSRFRIIKKKLGITKESYFFVFGENFSLSLCSGTFFSKYRKRKNKNHEIILNSENCVENLCVSSFTQQQASKQQKKRERRERCRGREKWKTPFFQIKFCMWKWSDKRQTVIAFDVQLPSLSLSLECFFFACYIMNGDAGRERERDRERGRKEEKKEKTNKHMKKDWKVFDKKRIFSRTKREKKKGRKERIANTLWYCE